MTLTVLTDEQVRQVLDNLTVDELEEFRHELATALNEFSTSNQPTAQCVYQQPHRITTLHPGTRATTLFMPSCGPSGMGCKVVSLTTGPKDPSLPDIAPTGVVNLLGPDGSPIGLVHASTLTAFRTALASACLVNRRNHVRSIAVFGSGAQAYWHVRLALMMRGSTIRHVNVINHRFSDRAGLLLKQFATVPPEVKEREGWADTKFSMLTPSFGEFARLQKEHLRDADVIFCCTPSRQDLFDASILTSHEGRKKGRLIVAIGSYMPDMRELPEGLLLQAVKPHEKHRHFHKHADEGGAIIVDTLDGVLKEAGEIISAKIDPRHLVELGELVMLQRLATDESETDSIDTESTTTTATTEPDDAIDVKDGQPSMSKVFGGDRRSSSRSSSPSGTAEPSRGSFSLPFRRNSASNASEGDRHKKEDRLSRWLRDGTVVYKSVGLGLMDLVVGMHLVKVARQKNVGTQVEGF